MIAKVVVGLLVVANLVASTVTPFDKLQDDLQKSSSKASMTDGMDLQVQSQACQTREVLKAVLALLKAVAPPCNTGTTTATTATTTHATSTHSTTPQQNAWPAILAGLATSLIPTIPGIIGSIKNAPQTPTTQNAVSPETANVFANLMAELIKTTPAIISTAKNAPQTPSKKKQNFGFSVGLQMAPKTPTTTTTSGSQQQNMWNALAGSLIQIIPGLITSIKHAPNPTISSGCNVPTNCGGSGCSHQCVQATKLKALKDIVAKQSKELAWLEGM